MYVTARFSLTWVFSKAVVCTGILYGCISMHWVRSLYSRARRPRPPRSFFCATQILILWPFRHSPPPCDPIANADMSGLPRLGNPRCASHAQATHRATHLRSIRRDQKQGSTNLQVFLVLLSIIFVQPCALRFFEILIHGALLFEFLTERSSITSDCWRGGRPVQ